MWQNSTLGSKQAIENTPEEVEYAFDGDDEDNFADEKMQRSHQLHQSDSHVDDLTYPIRYAQADESMIQLSQPLSHSGSTAAVQTTQLASNSSTRALNVTVDDEYSEDYESDDSDHGTKRWDPTMMDAVTSRDDSSTLPLQPNVDARKSPVDNAAATASAATPPVTTAALPRSTSLASVYSLTASSHFITPAHEHAVGSHSPNDDERLPASTHTVSAATSAVPVPTHSSAEAQASAGAPIRDDSTKVASPAGPPVYAHALTLLRSKTRSRLRLANNAPAKASESTVGSDSTSAQQPSESDDRALDRIPSQAPPLPAGGSQGTVPMVPVSGQPSHNPPSDVRAGSARMPTYYSPDASMIDVGGPQYSSTISPSSSGSRLGRVTSSVHTGGGAGRITRPVVLSASSSQLSPASSKRPAGLKHSPSAPRAVDLPQQLESVCMIASLKLIMVVVK